MTAPASPPQVLVVEDDERNVALLSLALGQGGLEAAFAPTVARARELLGRGLPRVVLLDLRLPDEPGPVLAREIRAAPGGDEVTILAVSASVLEATKREALEAGCNDFIEKPISPRDLVTRVRAALEAR